MTTEHTPPLSILAYPYARLDPVIHGRRQIDELDSEPGASLVWAMASGRYAECAELVGRRPGGLSLIVVLPPGDAVRSDPDLIHAVERARPHGILPHHPRPVAADLAQVLRRPPSDLAGEVTDYLSWRGLAIDRDTAHVIRRIIELSHELRSVSAVSRGMYLSRRALGRRLMSRGLPVPSHWLQIGRLLRIAVRLQNTEATVSSVAFDLGYPDGFAVSNQMERLTGFRPSQARALLGWEWLLEAWLRREAERGGLAPGLRSKLLPAVPADTATSAPLARPRPRKRRVTGRLSTA